MADLSAREAVPDFRAMIDDATFAALLEGTRRTSVNELEQQFLRAIERPEQSIGSLDRVTMTMQRAMAHELARALRPMQDAVEELTGVVASLREEVARIHQMFDIPIAAALNADDAAAYMSHLTEELQQGAVRGSEEWRNDSRLVFGSGDDPRTIANEPTDEPSVRQPETLPADPQLRRRVLSD